MTIKPQSKRANKIFYGCPGAWFGSMPHDFGSDTHEGTVTIDATYTVTAIAYLKRYYKITGTRASKYANGLQIFIADK